MCHVLPLIPQDTTFIRQHLGGISKISMMSLHTEIFSSTVLDPSRRVS